jgi:hypothetical protein
MFDISKEDVFRFLKGELDDLIGSQENTIGEVNRLKLMAAAVEYVREDLNNAPFERVPNEKGWERDHWNAMMERVKEPEGPYYKENMKRLQEQAFKDRKIPEDTFLLGELRKQGIESVELLKEIRCVLKELCRHTKVMKEGVYDISGKLPSANI